MRHITLMIIIVAGFLAATSCSNKTEEPKKTVGTSTKIEGDSTLYGLACDGCTDSVLVFLSGRGGDPVNYDIIDASKKRKVIGRPRVGDWVCLIVNGTDKKKADLVINLDKLKGSWVSLEKPWLRKRLDVPSLGNMDAETRHRVDSMLKIQLKPVEMGFALKRHYQARPIGMEYNRNKNQESPVVYPTPKFYTEWHIFNGQLVLTEGDLRMGNQRRVKTNYKNDTVDIVLLLRDSLRIRYKDGNEKGFYRK
ncbi:MAG: hypothetical protein IKX61_08265 [Prevotella sp.]|nr:hypothetical protein [Prevotella sp.]